MGPNSKFDTFGSLDATRVFLEKLREQLGYHIDLEAHVIPIGWIVPLEKSDNYGKSFSLQLLFPEIAGERQPIKLASGLHAYLDTHGESVPVSSDFNQPRCHRFTIGFGTSRESVPWQSVWSPEQESSWEEGLTKVGCVVSWRARTHERTVLPTSRANSRRYVFWTS